MLGPHDPHSQRVSSATYRPMAGAVPATATQAYFIALIFRVGSRFVRIVQPFYRTKYYSRLFAVIDIYILESFMTLIFRVELLACEGRRLFLCTI